MTTGVGSAFYALWEGGGECVESLTWFVCWDRYFGVWEQGAEAGEWVSWTKASSPARAKALYEEECGTICEIRQERFEDYLVGGLEYDGVFLVECSKGTGRKEIQQAMIESFVSSWKEDVARRLSGSDGDQECWTLFFGLDSSKGNPSAEVAKRACEQSVQAVSADGNITLAVCRGGGLSKKLGLGRGMISPSAWEVGAVVGEACDKRAAMILDMLLTHDNWYVWDVDDALWDTQREEILRVEAGLLAGMERDRC